METTQLPYQQPPYPSSAYSSSLTQTKSISESISGSQLIKSPLKKQNSVKRLVPRLHLSNIHLTDSTSSKHSHNPPTSIFTESEFSINKKCFNYQYDDTMDPVIENSVILESDRSAE